MNASSRCNSGHLFDAHVVVRRRGGSLPLIPACHSDWVARGHFGHGERPSYGRTRRSPSTANHSMSSGWQRYEAEAMMAVSLEKAVREEE